MAVTKEDFEAFVERHNNKLAILRWEDRKAEQVMMAAYHVYEDGRFGTLGSMVLMAASGIVRQSLVLTLNTATIIRKSDGGEEISGLYPGQDTETPLTLTFPDLPYPN